MMPGTIDEPAEASRRQTEPLVACVMLTAGRSDSMVQRAIRCYGAQTYRRRTLIVLDSGPRVFPGVVSVSFNDIRRLYTTPRSIGDLRNEANNYTLCDVIAHWDDDDWSHPDRLAEQVAALVVTGAEVVGYRDALFWDTTIEGLRRDYPTGAGVFFVPPAGREGSGWRYCAEHPDMVFGASLLYWRAVWEKNPFPSRNTGEDTIWLMRRKVYAMAGCFPPCREWPEPRMICGVHGGNTSTKIEAGHREWQRAAKFDDYCMERMQL